MAYYGCNVKDEQVKERIKKYVNILSEILVMDRGELLIEVMKYYIDHKKIDLKSVI